MKSLDCAKIRSSFSDYLDSAVSGQQMQVIAQHLDHCEACADEFAGLRAMQQSLATLGPVKAPADLGMRLRLPSRTSRLPASRTGSIASP